MRNSLKDPTGKTWEIEKIGEASNVSSSGTPPLSRDTLRLTSGDRKFVASIPYGWEKLDDTALWDLLRTTRG